MTDSEINHVIDAVLDTVEKSRVRPEVAAHANPTA